LARCGIGTYGIHSLDLDQKKGMPTSVAAITADYADQLIRVKPTGPFFLVGWSSGALFAFEIARELIRRGREVRRLVLLDPALIYFDAAGARLPESQEHPRPAPPTGFPPCPADEHGQLWWHFLSLISAEVAAGGTYPLDPAFWEMDDYARCEYLCANRRNQKLIKPSCMLSQANTPEDVHYIFTSVRNQAIAVAGYRPTFLQTSVSLFIAADDISFTPEQIDAWVAAREAMWKRLSAGFDLCTRVRGGHTAVVARPCVETVAQHIAAAIWSQT
jgi:thioesterase domain-containing protein